MSNKSIMSGVVLSTFMLSCAWAATPLDAVKACQSIRESARRLACLDSATKQLEAAESAKAEGEASKKEVDEKAKVSADANAMLTALLKLQTRTSTGLNYRDYSSELAEVKLALVQFHRSPSSKGQTKFMISVLQAISSYEDASQVWALKLRLREPNASAESEPLVAAMIKKYPAVERDYKSYKIETMHFDTAVGLIFNAAAARVTDASKVFDEQIR